LVDFFGVLKRRYLPEKTIEFMAIVGFHL